MVAVRGLADLAVEINDQLIEIKPNSLSFKGGLGEVNVRHQSGGGEAGSTVITEDNESKIGMVKFSLISTAPNADIINEWARITRDLNGNVIRLSGPGLTRNFAEMRLTSDPEVAVGSDADFEVTFEGRPAT